MELIESHAHDVIYFLYIIQHSTSVNLYVVKSPITVLYNVYIHINNVLFLKNNSLETVNLNLHTSQLTSITTTSHLRSYE